MRAAVACLLLYWTFFFCREALAGFASVEWVLGGRHDLAVDWKAANLFWRGISPYSPEGLEYVGVTDFGHPPTTPFWVLPLADLDHTQFAAFIGTLNLGMALALVAIVVYALGFPMPALVTALVFGVVESRPTALEHFRVIQISVWIAFAYALAWRWLRTGQDVKAGLALGCACTLKLFPALMVVFLLLERRWRAVATMGGAFLAVAAVMTWRWGLGAWTSFFEQQGPIAARALLDWRNASIHGVIRRAFNDVCLRGTIHDLAPTLVIWLVAVASLGAAVWLWRRAHQHQPACQRFDRAFTQFSVLSALLNVWIWEHYFYLLVLPLLIAWRSVYADARQLLLAVRARGFRAERVVLPAASIALASAATAVTYRAYSNTYMTNTKVHLQACRSIAPEPVQQWMLREARYFDLINWLPWVLFGVLFMVLLASRVEPEH